MPVRDLRDTLYVNDLPVRVTERLDVKGFRVRLYGVLKVLKNERIHESRPDTVIYQGVSQQIICSAVNVPGSDYMIARERNILDCICDGGCAGGNGKSCYSAFQSGYSLFKYILCRVRQTPVNIACISQGKSVCRVLAILEYKG